MEEIIKNESERLRVGECSEGMEKKSVSFIEQKVINDLAEGKNGGRMQTRFPPEPNGYLHIGHAKAIAIDFGLAKKYGGQCNLRFDDTNPIKEDTEYIESIENDIKWLGFKWANVYYASDYFQELWDFAVWLIQQGRAYVDEQSAEVIAQQKGTTTSPGTNSPYRDRPIEENLKLFEFMNSGKCEPGTLVLRAKIDMAHPNMLFRDPLIYRVLNIPHIRTGNKWNAYPMYDFTHGQSDYLEGVTHSWCTLEFVEHRPLYDLFVTWMKEWKGETDNIEDNRPRQTEFNKLNLNYTLMSKRNLLALVNPSFTRFVERAATPADPQLPIYGFAPFDPDYGDSYFIVVIPEEDVDGNFINPSQLYYNIFIDGELFTFDEDDYDVWEPMTEIPATYDNGEDIFSRDGGQKVIYFYFEGIESFGAQSYYTACGETHYSNLVTRTMEQYLNYDEDDDEWPDPIISDPVTTGIRCTRDATCSQVVNSVWYTADGQMTVAPVHGLNIRSMKMTDGTVKNIKMFVK